MQHMLGNILTVAATNTFDFQHILVTNVLSEVCTVSLQQRTTNSTLPSENRHKPGTGTTKHRNCKGNREIV